MTLNTELPGLTLRLWRPYDLKDLVKFGNNRKIWRNNEDSFPSPYSDVHAAQFLSLQPFMQPPTNYAMDFNGIAVGNIGFMQMVGNALFTARLKYWVGEPFWNFGIATAAVKAFTDYFLEELAFARLEAIVFGWNPASMRVLEKAGYQKEGVLKRSTCKDGEIIDTVIYALTQELVSPGHPSAQADAQSAPIPARP